MQQLGSVTNDDKTGCNFTCTEEQRISQTEDVTQVLQSKHVGVSQQRTHLRSDPLSYNVLVSHWPYVNFVPCSFSLRREKYTGRNECIDHMRSDESVRRS